MYMATSALRSSSSASADLEPVPGQADAEAGPRIDQLPADVVMQLQGTEDALRRCVAASAESRDLVEQDRELVSPEARDRVGRPHRVLEPSRDLLEDRVAGRMAETVVDGLEVVEVDEDDADRRASAPRALDRMLDAVCEESAVRELGDGIVERLVRELLLERLALADISAVQDDAAHMLVLEQVCVLHLELEPGSVAMLERALDDVCLGAAACVGLADAGEDLREPRPVGQAQ